MSVTSIRADRAGSRGALRPLARLAARWQGRWGWLALPLLALPAWAPLLRYGLLRGHDTSNHVLRLVNFDQHVRAGLLYPRWAPDLALGYGYPLYNFYGPASYYLMEVFHLAGAGYVTAYLAALGLLVLVAGLGMWLLASDVLRDLDEGFSHWLPLVAAVAYMYAPYLLTNIYIRGAVAEVMAQALLPWVLWAFRRLLAQPVDRRFVVAAALLLPLLMTAHTISMLLVPPFLAAYLVLGRLRRGQDLRGLAAAGLGALGAGAFFWLPLLVERSYIATGALAFSRGWMLGNFWDWHNFTDWSLVFKYRYDTPFQLGLTQAVLAGLGFGLARRRTREWVFLALGGLLFCLLMSRAAQPLWLAVPETAAIQFPWRLLGLASLPLALLTAGLLVPLRRPLMRAIAGLLLAGLVIFANRPRVDWVPTLPELAGAQTAPAIAQIERTVGDLGLSSNALLLNSDFIPRWVDLRAGLRGHPPPADQLSTAGVALSLTAASAYEWQLRVASERPATLRLSGFYFPGWRAWLDGQALRLYPSTSMGLLTVDVPAGSHDLRIAWAGTGVQWAATALSWLSLAALSIWAWRAVRPRLLALLPTACLAVGMLAWASRPPLAVLTRPPGPVEAQGLELLGTRAEVRSTVLDLHPYWLVRQTPADLEVTWELADASGQVVSQTRTRPYYDTLPTFSWSAGTVVDDAYRLALPPGLAAGDYALRFCFTPAEALAGCRQTHAAGTVTLPAVNAEAALPAGAQPLDLTFNSELELGGYTVTSDAGPLATSPAGHNIARAGQRLYYTLFWRTPDRASENYHSYIHLVDPRGNKVAVLDHTPGPFYYPPRLWDRFYWQPDPYPLTIPPETPSGVYQPLMGVYRFETLEPMPVTTAAGGALDSTVRLPSLKVLGAVPGRPEQRLEAEFAGLGQLLGYTLEPPATGVSAGSALTLTLYYRGQGDDGRDLHEFVHLYDAALGLAAQHDGPPQQGRNPTWAWLVDEVVTSVIPLQIDTAAPPGRYRLLLGFYDPAAGNGRLPALDAQGQPWTDQIVVLREIEIGP